jgi:hypothetical protein
MAVITIGNKTVNVPDIKEIKVPSSMGPGMQFISEHKVFEAGGVRFATREQAEAAIQAAKDKIKADYDAEVKATNDRVAREKAEAEAAQQQTATTTGGGTTVATNATAAPIGAPRPLSIEERNQRILDIMTAQSVGVVHPPDTKVELSPVQLQQDELLASQQIGPVDPITPTTAGAVPQIDVQGQFDAAATQAAKTEEIERARSAQLARADIAPEVSIEEADVVGTVSQQSLAAAQEDNLDPKATVQYQLESLYNSIVDGQPLPPWASGPVRIASQVMQQRGLGASSIAGAALVQAVQESAIPIAAADAQKYATIQLQNLNNRQQATLQNALTYSQMDQRNQDARMRSAIQNSQSFLSIDTANLTNNQQKEVLDFNTRAQEMFSNQSAENASRQFNAQSQNQIDSFFAQLGTQVEQRNSELQVAQDQFNVDQANTIGQFNQSLIDSRDKFNANLTAQINQSNAVWRRTINTANNATQNEANRINAQNLLALTSTAQNNLWQTYRDEAQWLIQTAENSLQRAHQAAILAQQQDFQQDIYRQSVKDNQFSAIGSLAGAVVGGLFEGGSGSIVSQAIFGPPPSK